MRVTKTFLLVMVLAVNAAWAQNTESTLPFPRTTVVPISDTQKDRAYELYVRLPASYTENNDKQYPVLYYTDAMWHVEMLSGSAEFLIEESILVGISWQLDIDEDLKKERGAHVSRFRDYSFSESSNPEHQAKYKFGQADNHLAFIRDEVIPFVESNYRTKTDQRTYFGYSMSGEFGAYILLAAPTTFKNYILGSPSLRDDDISVLAEVSSKSSSLDANVFISYGTEEEKSGKTIDQFIKLLRDRNDTNLALQHEVVEGTHQIAFPLTAVRSVMWLSELVGE